MTYQEAITKSLSVRWEVDTCSQGESCWCRTIKPVDPILYEDGDTQEEYQVVRAGELQRKTVEYLVDIHNKNIQGGIL